jgi:hypothetical protein
MTADVDDTAPLRLADAAAIAFPNGGMTAAGLRREAKRGRLVVSRIAGKDYTTLADIRGMIEQCRVNPKARTSGCVLPAAPGNPFGASKTETSESARAAALASLNRLSKSCGNTSPTNTKSRASNNLTPIKSKSRTSSKSMPMT